MRVRSIHAPLLAATLGLLSTSGALALLRPARAQADTPSAGAPAVLPETVVARVGDQVLTVADVDRRIAQVPPFQLQSFGSSPAEIRKSFVESVLVRELLLAQGAIAQKALEREDVKERVRGALRGAMLQRIQNETVKSATVTDDEVHAYYEANRDKFNSPARVTIWHIQVATREEAAAILADLKKDLSPQRWNDVVREKSLDKTTNLRSGNLGMVLPDGSTAEPAVKVDPRVLEAVARVKDAELVPEPVPEGERFAVVWRRQSMKAVTRTLEQEAPSIRQVIARNRIDARVKQLLERLHAQDLSSYTPELVELIDITSSGDVQPLRRPGTLASSRRPGVPPPSPVPRHGDLR